MEPSRLREVLSRLFAGRSIGFSSVAIQAHAFRPSRTFSCSTIYRLRCGCKCPHFRRNVTSRLTSPLHRSCHAREFSWIRHYPFLTAPELVSKQRSVKTIRTNLFSQMIPFKLLQIFDIPEIVVVSAALWTSCTTKTLPAYVNCASVMRCKCSYAALFLSVAIGKSSDHGIYRGIYQHSGNTPL